MSFSFFGGYNERLSVIYGMKECFSNISYLFGHFRFNFDQKNDNLHNKK